MRKVTKKKWKLQVFGLNKSNLFDFARQILVFRTDVRPELRGGTVFNRVGALDVTADFCYKKNDKNKCFCHFLQNF